MNQNVWKDLIALFYPNICLTCDKPMVSGEQYLCLNCFLSLSRVQRETRGENDLLSKFAVYPEVVSARSFMSFEGSPAARKLIHAFKYGGKHSLACFLGRLMAGESRSYYQAGFWNAIVPVPLHSSRLRERGYNQAEKIADGFGEVLDIPVMTDLIVRVKRTHTQTGKNKLNRWKSTSEIYVMTREFDLSGKNILIIDDVVTTGATVSGIIEILIKSGVQHVGIVSLASE